MLYFIKYHFDYPGNPRKQVFGISDPSGKGIYSLELFQNVIALLRRAGKFGDFVALTFRGSHHRMITWRFVVQCVFQS